MAKQKTYIAIDLKSFYASVECKERNRDPLTTNLVVADKSRTEKTICLAVSPSLKSYGIPGRPRLFEVVQKVKEANNTRRWKAPNRTFTGSSDDSTELNANPALEIDYIVAPPRMAYYLEYSTKIYSVYNSFCLDEEDINPLQNFVAQIKSADSDSVIYVSTYGYEITNSKGEKSTYADALWIDTVLPISQIERYIEKSGVAEPSNISFVGDSDECGNYKVWIIAQEENNPHIIELTDRKKIDHMIILYWD